MQGMAQPLRERMLKRMVRDGQLGPESSGLIADYAHALGLVTLEGGGSGAGSEDWAALGLGGVEQADTRASAQRKGARNNLADKALQRRMAAMEAVTQGAAAPLSDRSESSESFTGSSYSGTTIDTESDEAIDEGQLSRIQGEGTPSATATDAVHDGGSREAGANAAGDVVASQSKKGGWFGGFSSLFVSTKADAGNGAHEDKPKRHRRKHHRRRRKKQQVPAGSGDAANSSGVTPMEASGIAGGPGSIPSFMLPLYSKLQQQQRESLQAGGEAQRFARWRFKWDGKFVAGGLGGEMNDLVLSPASTPRSTPQAPPAAVARTPPSYAAVPPLSRTATHSTMTGSMYSTQANSADSRWDVVRGRLHEITELSC